MSNLPEGAWDFGFEPPMTDPNGWSYAVREAVAHAIIDADQVVPPGWEGWLQEADAALTALAPFVAAREAAAEMRGRRDGCTLAPELPLEALPPPSGASALTLALAAAKREGMKAAAAWHDEQAAYCSRRAAERMAEGHRGAFGVLKTVQATHENSAKALRAAAKEIEP